MSRLAREFGPRGILFFGIHPGPEMTAQSAAAHAASRGLPFSILLDPEEKVARQAGVRITPEAVVLAPDGQIVYRCSFDERNTEQGEPRPDALAHDLESALAAILRDEMPRFAPARPLGGSLPRRAAPKPGDKHEIESVTFTKDVAPILWKNCAAVIALTPSHPFRS